MPRVQLYVSFLRNWLCICAYRWDMMRPHHKIWQTIHSRHGRHGSLGSASPHALFCSFGSVAAIHTFDMTLRSTCSRCKWTVQDSHGSLKFIEVHWSALKLIVVHLRSLMFIEVLWSSLNFIDVHCADAHSAWLCRRWPQRAVQRDLIGLTCCNLESGRLFGPRSKDGRHPGLIGLAHGEGPGGPGMGLGVAWHSIAQRLSIVRFRQDRNSAPDSKRQSFKDSDGQRCGTAMATRWMGQWSLMLDQLQLVDGTYWQDTIFFSHELIKSQCRSSAEQTK